MNIESFKTQLDIIEVIGSLIPLKKAGVNYQAHCPFHSEKSPSFIISPAKQIYKCFGCGVSGDAISFYQNYKKLEFAEAVTQLTQMYNLTNPINQKTNNFKDLQERLQKLSKDYTANLLESSEIATKLREYLAKRGFSSEDITKFSLGYAKGNEWQSYFNSEEAQSIGILNTKGNCLFSNRLIITLFSASYKPIGFVGRTHPYFNFRNSPKYINSKESLLYQKSKNFYNFARAKAHIIKEKKVLIVEGYFDALSAWQMGIKNCIATGGVAFNKTFLAQITPLECELIFLFDNDSAGQANTLNALKVCIDNGYTNIYKGTLKNPVKDLGEVLESITQAKTKNEPQDPPRISKTKGIPYYLQTSLNTLKSAKEKDTFINEWRNYIVAQQNYFFKNELIEITNHTLGFNILNPTKKVYQHVPLQAQVYKSILVNENLEYIAGEYLYGEELGEFKESFINFFYKRTRDERAQRLELDSNIVAIYDYKEFKNAMRECIGQYYNNLIQSASVKKDYKRARELSHYLRKVQQELSV